ncbi:MAG: PQQ-binding-like beta-propeller repeat protein [Candidatus Wallbacteria bacterium]|nr:PQQ-binding-like beta-propeller repeat protein [Candidatus Wallbacteria bacterium]
MLFFLITADHTAFATSETNLEWVMAGGDSGRSYCSDLNLNSLNQLWTFTLDSHVWEYRQKMSVWSESAVAGNPDGNLRIFIGSYDHNLYCIDAKDGREIWRYTTGAAINSSPLYFRLNGKAFVLAVSTDRVVYCLDALSGKPAWTREIYPWSFTVYDAVTSSPVLAESGGMQRIILTIWYSDKKMFKPVQKSEVLSLEPSTGVIIWRKTLGMMNVFSPVSAVINGQDKLFVTSADGNLFCLSQDSGEVLWKFTTSLQITSAPVVSELGTKVYFGTMFGVYYAIDAVKGKEKWKDKLGMNIVYPGSLDQSSKTVIVPDFDRNIYAIETDGGKILWKFRCGKYNSSSPVIFKYKNRQVVLVASLDNLLYLLDLKTGDKLWEFSLGGKLWSYDTRGQTLWPSPLVCRTNGRGLLVVPWYDGKVYAFGE